MYDYIFLTLDSSFYKVNLYNELSQKMKIFVIFLCSKNSCRDEKFLNHKKNFEYIYLSDSVYEKRNKILNVLKILKILKIKKYKKLVLGGWDSLENWSALFFSSKNKNALVIESSEFESTNRGIKGLLKKIFVSRISLGFASGESQIALLKNVGYKNEIRKTKGVGIFNYKKINIIREISEVKKFLYVGRLSSEKNVEQIIDIFNKIPELELNIVGYGPLEVKLKNKANKNINFLGKIENDGLSQIYQENDVFILPSKSEAWGLVVEEALYNGLPVILSNKVGCHTELIKNGEEGYIYDLESEKDFKGKIYKMINLKNYLRIKENVKKMNFELIKKGQLKSYEI